MVLVAELSVLSPVPFLLVKLEFIDRTLLDSEEGEVDL